LVSQSRNGIVACTSIDRFNVGRLELLAACLGRDDPPSGPRHLYTRVDQRAAGSLQHLVPEPFAQAGARSADWKIE
jgi:hypothetical protein